MKRNTDNPSFSNLNNHQRRFQSTNSNRQLIYDKIQAKRKRNQNLQKKNSINKYKNYDQAHPPRTKTPQPETQPKTQTNNTFHVKKYSQHTKTQQSDDFQPKIIERQIKNPLTQELNEQGAKLQDKLNMIQNKIGLMKDNLKKKRQQKLKKRKQKQQKKEREKNEKKKPPALKNLVTQVPEHKEYHNFDKNPYSPNHNIYYVSQIVRAYQQKNSLAREHLQTTLQIMAYFQKTPKPQDSVFEQERLNLQRKQGYQGKKTVIFDLDQTLIHCNESLDDPHDVQLPITFPTGQIIEAGVNIRPYARQILQNLHKDFEIIVFTASHSCYANVVLDYLDPHDEYIHHRLYRENCYTTPEGMHVKDLRVLNRQMKDMVLVDNAAYSYINQPQNGIPIIPYYHGQQDYELQTLEKYIKSLLFVGDVREKNKQVFKLEHYKKYYNDLETLVEELYLPEH